MNLLLQALNDWLRRPTPRWLLIAGWPVLAGWLTSVFLEEKDFWARTVVFIVSGLLVLAINYPGYHRRKFLERVLLGFLEAAGLENEEDVRAKFGLPTSGGGAVTITS